MSVSTPRVEGEEERIFICDGNVGTKDESDRQQDGGQYEGIPKGAFTFFAPI